jgi:D-threo-aldose 1-dehydrogenase
MKISSDQHRPLGATGLCVPPVVFGSDMLNDAARVIPHQTKLAIFGEWFKHVGPPVFIDVAGEPVPDTALNVLGGFVKRLDISPQELLINIRLPLRQIEGRLGAEEIHQWLKHACDSLGKELHSLLITVDGADENLAISTSPADHERGFQETLAAINALSAIKAAGRIRGIGISASDSRMAKAISDMAKPDFVILVGGLTVMRHPPEVLDFVAGLADRNVAIINAGILRCGFLVGGTRFDNRVIRANEPADQPLFAWRKAFTALCHGYGISPAHASIQFALSPPGVVAVLLNTTYADRVAENVESVVAKVPDGFWASMKEEGLIAADYRHLG